MGIKGLRGKRSQTSVYIVIGLVILIGFGIFFYIKSMQKPITGPIQRQKSDVEQYVLTCLQETAEKGLLLLGSQGGYINIPDDIRLNPMAHVSLDQRGVMIVPFWYYDGSDMIPTNEDIESQLALYVDQHIDECLNNFSGLSRKYDFVIIEPPNTDVVINPASVDFNLNYKIKAITKSGESSKTFDKFQVSLDVKLAKILDFGRRFMLAENRDGFLEQATLDLMAANPNIPFDGLEFHCKRLQWDLRDIKSNLSDVLAEVIPYSRVMKTKTYPFLADEKIYKDLASIPREDIYNEKYPGKNPLPVPEDAYVYNHLYFNVTDKDFSDLAVHIDYNKNYGLNIYARPSRNGILRANSQPGYRKYLSYLCINTYHFTYDVNYPVIIYIRDDSALNNRGFIFRFATPVNIDHNEPMRALTEPKVYFSPSYNADFCNNLGDELYTIKVFGNDKGYVNVEINNADIYYDCLKYECPIGKTHGEGGETKLVTYLPQNCKYGYLVARKDGYLEGRVQAGKEKSYEIQITKLKNFSIAIQKISSVDLKTETAKADTDSYLIQFLHTNLDYSASSYIDNSTVNPSIELIDGDAEYEVNVYAINSKTNNFFGGYMANWSYQYVNTTDASEILIKVVDYIPHPITDEEQGELVKYLEQNETYKSILKPVLR